MSKKLGFTALKPSIEVPEAGKKPATKSIKNGGELEVSAYEAHKDFVDYYKNKQEESIKKFKEKYPNGVTITEGELINTK